MTHRLIRPAVVMVVIASGWLVLGLSAAAADGRGDPHAAGTGGDPHIGDTRGDPHTGPVDGTVTDALAVAPEATVAAAADNTGAPQEATLEAAAAKPADQPDPPQTGKPPDGSVGNADDKSPGGQAPQDRNRGYECDDNQGIGKGNPAHSPCTTPPAPPNPPVTPAITPVTPAVAAQVAASPSAEVLGVQVTRSAAAPALARTGTNLSGQGAAAAALIVLGVGLLAIARRRAPAC